MVINYYLLNNCIILDKKKSTKKEMANNINTIDDEYAFMAVFQFLF
jgi:hypothetical protein